MTIAPIILPSDIAVCRAIHKQHGTTYYWATQFFPRRIRIATHVLYAFFRVPDEIVDAPNMANPGAALAEWMDEWHRVAAGAPTEQPVLRAAAQVFAGYHIPLALGDAFLRAMHDDLTVTRYRTYTDLQRYMYGSAEVVGEIMTRLFGVTDEVTLARARALGEAMQLTNFLRDIGEDLQQRNRVYLPQEDLARFGVREDDLVRQQMSDNFVRCMKFEIVRARRLYAEAEQGIAQLPSGVRLAVRIASRLYAAILVEIERQGCNVFTRRARVSTLRKIFLIILVCKNSVGR